MELNIKLENNLVLRGMINSPGDGMKAMVILVHGLGEHIMRYQNWIERFSKDGIGFIGVDLPGHGKSDGSRGFVRSYSHTNEMIDILIKEYSNTFPGIPLFLYGQSLGGGIVLKYVLEHSPALHGAIVSSPWLRLSFEPARIKVILAKVMNSIFPSFVQPSGLVTEHISHDERVVEAYRKDPLVHDRISASLFFNAVTAAGYALKNAGSLSIPLLIMHGTDDRITSPEGSRSFVSSTELAEYKEWEGGYHELHNEPFKDEVYAYILNWINKHL